MNRFPLFSQTDRLCSKCRLHLAEPMAWLCQTCREELDHKWKRVTRDIDPDPLELEPIKMPTRWERFPNEELSDKRPRINCVSLVACPTC